MPKYRKKPVVIEAEQWDHHNSMPSIVEDFNVKVKTTASCDKCGGLYVDHGWVPTLEGGHIVCPGDWIITGVQGEHYPCKEDIFEMTYELVEE